MLHSVLSVSLSHLCLQTEWDRSKEYTQAPHSAMPPGGSSGEPGAGSVSDTCIVAVAPALVVTVAPALAAPVSAGEVALPVPLKLTQHLQVLEASGRKWLCQQGEGPVIALWVTEAWSLGDSAESCPRKYLWLPLRKSSPIAGEVGAKEMLFMLLK